MGNCQNCYLVGFVSFFFSLSWDWGDVVQLGCSMKTGVFGYRTALTIKECNDSYLMTEYNAM